MDVSFATKVQQFSPISCILLSSNSCSLLYPCKFRPICREFLGSSHNLRPPGRQKCKRLGFHIQSPRFIFRTSAALDAQSILVVVSVIIVSALTVVYLNYSNRKENKENAKKIPEPLDLTESRQTRSMMNLVVKDKISSPVDLQGKASAGGNKDTTKEIIEINHDSEDKFAPLQSRETVMVHEETLTTDALVPLGSDTATSSITEFTSLRKYELSSQDSEPHVLESGALSVSLATEMGDVFFERQQEFELGSELHEEILTTDALVPPGFATAASSISEVTSLRQYEFSSQESEPHVLESGVLSVSLATEMGDVFFEGQQEIELGSELHEETLTTDALVPPGFDAAASSIGESTFLRQYVLTSQEFEPHVLESGSLATEMGDVFSEGQHEIEVGSELPKVRVKTELIAASVPVNDVLADTNELEKQNHGLLEVGDIVRYNGVATEFVRKELHTFYEANQYAMSSVENLNSMKHVPSYPALKNKRFFSAMSSSTFESKRFSTKDFIHTAGKIPRGHYREDHFHGRKDFLKSRESGSDNGKGMRNVGDLRSLFTQPQPKKESRNDFNYSSQQLSAYIRFLREGRLLESLEKLEYLERKGLLDMNNVYHAGSFRVCKSQKAVKEAFLFTNLIPNPTLSTFNMLMSVCANSQDSDGAFEILRLVQSAGLKADCKLYTTLISTCAKSRKVDTMFKVFHLMVNSGVEPNVHTYGALIDGCAKAGQVAKAFGAYGIMRSKNVKPDRVVFNALITACGQSGAVDRAFDVLSEMRAETHPIDPDHVTEMKGSHEEQCAAMGTYQKQYSLYSETYNPTTRNHPNFRWRNESYPQVYLLTVLKGLKHRLAAGAKLPNLMFLLPIARTQIHALKREKTINVAGRITQAISALLRRLRLTYPGNESFGKIRINGVVIKRWFQPKVSSFSGKPTDYGSSKAQLGKGITNQQRNIRTGNLALE